MTNVMPTLLDPPAEPVPWMPRAATDARQVVLLVLDGLGWHQLLERRSAAPTLAAMAGSPVTTVVPSTTSTALTSIATGVPPGEHGIVGYRMAVHGEVLNVLRWSTPSGDAHQSVPPAKLATVVPFLGERPPIVTRADYRRSGFTAVHLEPGRFCGYRTMATLEIEIERHLRRSEPFVYAYYDGLDKVAHEYGLGEHYDAELAWLDILVDRLLSRLPRHAALVVSADHGQVEVGDNVVTPASAVLGQTSMQSGEGRFRWLHARPGRARALYDAAVAHHADQAWVVTRDQLVTEGWMGPVVTEAARARLGDVALIARGNVAFHDPQDTGPYQLIGRHGSVTPAEMLVPVLVAGR